MTNKTIIYCRLSTNKQDVWMAVQVSALRSYCNIKQWNNIEIVKEVESGKGICKRDGLKNILNLIQNWAVWRVLIYKLDRLGRKLKDILEIIELLKEHGVDFVSLSENFDTSTPAWIAFLQITWVFAEFERNMISTRTKEALQEKKKQGVKLWKPSIITKELTERVREMRYKRYTWAKISYELGVNYRTAKKAIK